MKFVLDKCAKASLKRVDCTENLDMVGADIRELLTRETYKYLGIKESSKGLGQTELKGQVKKEFLQRIRLIMRTELTSKNKFIAIRILEVPVIEYGVGLIDWKAEELRSIDKKKSYAK